MSDTYYRSTNKNHTAKTLHADPDCRHLQNSRVREADPDKHPHRGWCSHCTEKADAPESDAGGSLHHTLENLDPKEVSADE